MVRGRRWEGWRNVLVDFGRSLLRLVELRISCDFLALTHSYGGLAGVSEICSASCGGLKKIVRSSNVVDSLMFYSSSVRHVQDMLSKASILL
jgi:hypothetical protein